DHFFDCASATRKIPAQRHVRNRKAVLAACRSLQAIDNSDVACHSIAHGASDSPANGCCIVNVHVATKNYIHPKPIQCSLMDPKICYLGRVIEQVSEKLSVNQLA